jgi:DNA-binding LacI/PurR family transcriptional regulator
LTKHLIAQGHRRIGFTTRPELGTVNDDRYAGYRQALAEAGIPLSPELIVETAVQPNSGRAAMETLLALPTLPTALFAFYDLMAVDAAQVAQEHGLQIPDDLAIAGFDGLRSSYIATPQITTVEQPLAQMGQQATEILLQHAQNRDLLAQQRTLPVRLLVRESTVGKGVRVSAETFGD